MEHYYISNRDRELLKTLWWANWCWWKGWVNFSKIIKNNIETFNQFNINKAESLFENIEDDICFPHDIDFSLWGNIFSFYIANFKFGYRLFKLMRWASFWERLFIWMLAYYLLNKCWRKYFHFWTKRTLLYLLNNKN